jgi:hypothetical protein
MIPEYFIDKIGNISVQGSVVSLDLCRMVPNSVEGAEKDAFSLEKKLTVTLTGQNFIALVNSLNQTVKAISERQNKDTGTSKVKKQPTKPETSQ